MCLEAYTTIEAISREDAKEQDAVAVRIYRELAPHIEKRMGNRIKASELHELLTSDPESDFYDWFNGKPISAKRMKKILIEAGVSWFRVSEGSFYNLHDLKAQIERYVR